MYTAQDIFNFYDKLTKKGDCWLFPSNLLQYGRSVSIFIEHKEVHSGVNIYKKCKSARCVNPAHLGIIKREEVQLKEYNGDSTLLGLLSALDETPQKRESYIRAPFGYIGNKESSTEYILKELPHRNIYVEVFGGSGTILLSREPCPLEVYNDRFGGVTAFYRVLRDPVLLDKLLGRIELTIHSREEFIWCRDTWDIVEDEVERAARWYYMNQNSFSKKGQFFARATSGRAQHGNAMRNNLKWFPAVHERLRNVQVENQDWRLCLKDYDSEDTVFYLDPPYLSYAKGCYKHEISKEEHIELCERIFQLKGFVALSGYGDDITRELYGHYPWDTVREWSTNCSMLAQAYSDTNGLAGKKDILIRSKANEMLFIKE